MNNNLFATEISTAALVPGVTGAPRNNSAPSDAQKRIRQLFELSRQVRVSLRDAIAVAEERHHGSRTVRIGFDKSASPCYRVRTVRDAEIW